MNEKIITVIAILMSYALLQGCAGQSRVESGFGDAVREVTRNQIYDANAADYPDPDAVEGGDSYRLENVVEAHRTDVSKPQEVGASTVFGGGSSTQ